MTTVTPSPLADQADVPAVPRRDRNVRWGRDHRLPARLLILVALVALALSAVFPLYFMVQAAFRTQAQWNNSELAFPTSWSLSTLKQVWLGGDVGAYLRNSTVITLGSTILSIAVSTMAGFSFSKVRWRLRGVTYFFVISWLALPPVVLIVPIYIEMVQLHLINTYFSVILLYTAFNIPFDTFLMTAFFRSLPDELVEAARIDNASPHQIFRLVLVPLAKPALGTLAIFNILYAWNEFIFALLLLSPNNVKTLTVGVLQLQGRYTIDYPVIMAGLLVASIPVVAAYLFFQRFLVLALKLERPCIDQMRILRLEFRIGFLQRIEACLCAHAVSVQELRARKTQEERRVVAELSHEQAFVKSDGIMKASPRDIFLRKRTLGIDRTHHLGSAFRISQRTVRIGNCLDVRREFRGMAAAQHTGHHFDREIGERAGQRKKDDRVNPEKRTAGPDHVNDTRDLKQNRRNEEEIAHQICPSTRPDRAYQLARVLTS